jgi:hypothetical protein
MDLLQTVRKEGSRGGRADFKWEDVRQDTHRENYLGHSVMARKSTTSQIYALTLELTVYSRGQMAEGQRS